jgi:hypothetical protein
MKKIFLLLLGMVSLLTAEAKVVKITLADGSVKIFTSSQLSAIDFNEDGTLSLTTYDGEQLPPLAGKFEMIEIGDDAAISDIYPDNLSFNIDADGVPVDINSERSIVKVNYVYPSTDPFGQSITLSGTMLIPSEIWSGEAKSEGILMMNHYTKFHRDEAPTISNGELENMLLANPLKPNYIIVESDFYGFGTTVRFQQAFLQGLANARASLDGLLAAQSLLRELGFDYGPLCFNIGYSSAGYDALAAQKLRDIEYADRISFDKTFSGGGPSDVCEAYRQYVIKDRTAYNAVPLLLMVSTNETQKLNLEYKDVFQPEVASRIDELIFSKSYSSWPVCDAIGRDKLVSEILSGPYCNLSSIESQNIQDILRGFNMTNDDWTPDPSQRIYLFHSRGDDYVPIESARPMVAFLKSKGMEPSIIPGRTNFQTNFVVRNMGHLSATLIYFVQTLSAIQAWPQMYTDNQLNPTYQKFVGTDIDLVGTLRQLDAMGFDCRSVISQLQEQLSALGQSDIAQGIDLSKITQATEDVLNQMGFTKEELLEMAEDSGIDITKTIVDFIIYMSENPADGGDTGAPALQQLNRAGSVPYAPLTPADEYAQQLRDWLKAY